jgi:hypothetical protein
VVVVADVAREDESKIGRLDDPRSGAAMTTRGAVDERVAA